MGEQKKFLSICLTPTMQRTMRFPSVEKGEVNRTSEYRIDASGKGVNVTRVLDQLGEEVTHLTHLGGSQREDFLKMIEADGLEIDWVTSESEIRTCYTVVDDREHSTTELVEEAKPVSRGTEERLRERYLEILSDYHTVIISGNKSAGYSDRMVPWLVGAAKERGVRVVADFRGADLLASLKHRPDILKPNFSEFAGTFLMGGTSPFGPERAKGKLSEHSTPGELEAAAWAKMRELAELGMAVVLTRGSQPTMFALPGGIEGTREPIRVEPLNTIGCGDAFTAGLAAEWRQSGDFDAALEKAHVCASMNASLLRPGVIR
jgi:1-phosphofructokinase/tagatose 6-phosphate kinase